MAARGWGLFSLYIYIENMKKSSCQKPLDQFQYNLADMFPWWPFIKIVQAVKIVKKYGCYGWGLFPLYIYIENFNDLLVRNHWTDLNITLQECVLCNHLSRLFKPSWFVKEHGSQCVGLIFPIYHHVYRKLFCQKPLDRFQYNLAKIFPWWPFTKSFSCNCDLSKNMAAY